MNKKKKVYLGLSIAIAMITLIVVMLYSVPKKLTTVDIVSVNKIEIFNGESGELLTIDDSDELEYLIDDFNNVELKRVGFVYGYTGFNYWIKIYNEDNKEIDDFYISGDIVKGNNFFYEFKSGGIDIEHIDELFNN